MRIIRDEQGMSPNMIALLIDWNIRRCNVVDCRAMPTTIVGGARADVPVFGMCEEHFQASNQPGGAVVDLEFDDYDALGGRHEQ